MRDWGSGWPAAYCWVVLKRERIILPFGGKETVVVSACNGTHGVRTPRLSTGVRVL